MSLINNINLKQTITYFTVILILLISYFIYYNYIETTEEYHQFEQQLENSLKSKIRMVVDNTLEQIIYQQNQAKFRLKTELKEHVNQAHRIALHIYNKYKDTKTIKEIHEILHDALFSITWDNGNGYYFIMDLEGKMQIHYGSPRLQGKNVINLQDKKGKFIIQEFINIAKTKKFGYSTYYWEKPDNKDKGEMFLKYSFIRLVKPLNWLIGAGEYLDDIEILIKKEMEQWIKQIKLEHNGYIFILNSKGKMLLHPDKSLVGKNVFNLKDVKQNKFMQNIIKSSKTDNSRFTKYWWENSNNNNELAPKITYARYFPQWDWVIGYGIHLTNSQYYLDKQNTILKERLILIFIISSFIFLMIYYLIKSISAEFFIISNFLNKSALKNKLLNPQQFKIQDFRFLSIVINEMIKNRQEKEKKINAIVENTNDGILIIENGKFSECNNGSIKILGAKNKTEVLNLSLEKISPKKQADGRLSSKKANEMMSIAIKNGTHSFEWLHQRINGEIFPADVSLTVIKHNSKNVIFISWRDITEHKQAENDKINLAKEREAKSIALLLNKKIETKNAELIKLNQEKNEFLGIAAHDLKNPLSAIKGYAEEIYEEFTDMSDEEIIEYSKMIKISSEKMFTLITNLLDVNAIESGKVNLKLIKMDILPILKSVVEHYKNIAQKKSIKINFNYRNNIKYCANVDEDATYQIFDNLISNAVKYSPHGKNICIKLFIDDKTTQCEIKDEGAGLSIQDKDKLFGKFQKLSPRPTAGEHSTGLGLFIVHKLVNAMSGKIWCESKTDNGAKFIVNFPN